MTEKFGGLKVTNQKFGTAVSGITPESFDGIIGVSYAISAQIDKKTVLDRLKEQNQIKNRVFCTKMNVEKKASSEVIFGGCDVEADYWLPNVVKDYWKVNLTKIVLTSKADGSELLTIDTNAIAVFDTGAGNYLGNDRKKWNNLINECVQKIIFNLKKNRYANTSCKNYCFQIGRYL